MNLYQQTKYKKIAKQQIPEIIQHMLYIENIHIFYTYLCRDDESLIGTISV